MTQRVLTKAQVIDRFGESPKQIELYVKAGMPCEGTGRDRRYPWPEIRNWRDERLRKIEREATERRLKPATADDAAEAKRRQQIDEARMTAIDLAEREAKLVTIEHLDAVVGDIGDRMRAVLINLPSNYLLPLERVGVSPEKGQAVLESIAEDLTKALRGVADEVEGDDDSDSDHIAA